MITESIWDEVDEMPSTFEDMKALSESFLKRAIRGLLIEACDRGILSAPYGRPIQPTPLINLDEFLRNGGLDKTDHGDVNDETDFVYEYGFDPLAYLVKYLKFLHPTNIRRMKDERRTAAARLAHRANHARSVLGNFGQLKDLTRRLRSGILWGPFISASVSSSLVAPAAYCVCRSVKSGDIVVELSKDAQFDVIESSWTQSVKDPSTTQKIVMADLESGAIYYVRCCLMDNIASSNQDLGASKSKFNFKKKEEESAVEDTRQFRGPIDGFFEYSKFVTPPCDHDGQSDNLPLEGESVRIIAMNVSSTHLSVESITSEEEFPINGCSVTCLLGSLYTSESKELVGFLRADSRDEMDLAQTCALRTFDLHRHSNSFRNTNSILRNSSMLFAWHDRSLDSDITLSEEEAFVRKYLHDVKKHDSKYGKGKEGSKQRSADGTPENIPPPPKFKSFRISSSLTGVLQTLPVEMEMRRDKPSARQLYSTSMVGPHVQVFVLDHRRGYLGRDQTSWLTDALGASTARFKIILTGCPFGASSQSGTIDDVCRENDRQTVISDSVGVGSAYLDSNETNDSSSIEIAVANVAAMMKDSTSSGVTPPATVSMQVPPPIAALGVDDAGRLKLSLSAIIATYQETCIKRQTSNTNIAQNDRADDPAAFTQDSLTMQHTLMEFNNSDMNPPSDEHSIMMDSGLLILSAGACIPVLDIKVPIEVEVTPQPVESKKRLMSSGKEGSRETSRRIPIVVPPLGETYTYPAPSSSSGSSVQGPSVSADVGVTEFDRKDSLAAPFVATYDPKGTGKPFCLEVCVGGGGGIGSNLEDLLPVKMLPALGAEVIFTVDCKRNSGIDESENTSTPVCTATGGQSYSAVATLTDDARSIDLQLLALQSNQKHSIIFRCKLSVPVNN